MQNELHFLTRFGLDFFRFHAIFKAFHPLQGDSSCGNGDHVVASALEVMRLESLLGGYETVISLHPPVIRSIGAAIFAGKENASRRDVPVRIKHGNCNSSSWFQVLLSFD